MYPNLKLQLWRSGIRQNRLAQMLQIDQTLLSRMVNGFRAPDCEMRAKIAALLNSDEEWLFESTERSTGTPTATEGLTGAMPKSS
jgi:transcriptional regulator with XRE-family HTH domain